MIERLNDQPSALEGFPPGLEPISANLRTQCSGPFVIPANPGSGSGAGAGIQRITYE